ncbi:MAG: cysteine rich repeat-containing protein [Rhodospirillaceae bacterium]
MLKLIISASWVIAVFVIVTTCMPVQAQKAEIPAEPNPACAADAKKLCTDIKGSPDNIKVGPSNIIDCLKKNAETVTPECKVALTATKPPVAQSPCKADIEKLCPAIEPGQGRYAECLHKNMAMLSAQCRVYQIRIRD